tara:strand:- start:434 stop:763 length:330 start_codon:yes stop_codon:yes gene_type:complete
MKMNKDKIVDIVKYLSLALVISFLFLKNIYIVLIGIILSILVINETFIYNIIKKNNHNISEKKDIDIIEESKLENIALEKNGIKISLAETIEEIGYIPSLEKNNENEAA